MNKLTLVFSNVFLGFKSLELLMNALWVGASLLCHSLLILSLAIWGIVAIAFFLLKTGPWES